MKVFRIGHTYKDRGGVTKDGDEFLAWVNLPGSGMLNSPGIRPLKYVHKLSPLPAYLILVTHEKRRGMLNPWDDVIDHSTGQILYWGDAKFDKKKRHIDFTGNKVLEAIYHYLLDGHMEFSPPILHFSKPQKGEVRFNGLCVLDRLELSWFDDHGKPVRNFRAHLTILDVDEVSISWLHERASATSAANLVNGAPVGWKQYLKGNIRKLDLWKSSIRSTKAQLPPEGSPDSNILLQLGALTPTQFEAIVVALFSQMTTICHSITRTRPTADGGFDFYGSFVLPRPLAYAINFIGEAKKYSRSTPVQPKDVSRLVARLGRGQFGIFVTTSYFSKQTQAEVLADAYPVRLIPGLDLINMMRELRLVSAGRLNQAWVDSVCAQPLLSPRPTVLRG
jgi:restriction endonuclease Mrr